MTVILESVYWIIYHIGGRGLYQNRIPERARVGQFGEPVAELAKLDWVVIFPDQVSNMLFPKTSAHHYEKSMNSKNS